MEIVTFVIVVFLQLASLSLDQFRETIEAIKTALADQYVEVTEGAGLGQAPADVPVIVVGERSGVAAPPKPSRSRRDALPRSKASSAR